MCARVGVSDIEASNEVCMYVFVRVYWFVCVCERESV